MEKLKNRFLGLCILLFCSCVNSYAQAQWDKEGSVYVNYDYGFSWVLDKDLDWQKTIGTERHTIFRAKNKEYQIIVFVNAQRYNLEKSGLDIWKHYDFFFNLYSKEMVKLAESKGFNHKLVTFEKTRLFGENAIRIVSEKEPQEGNASSEPPTTQYTIRTFDHGLSYSLNIIVLTRIDKLFTKNDIHIDDLFNGFKFLAN